MKQVPSPNFDARATGIALDYIVLHYTGMKDGPSALARMRDPEAKVSAHYMIDEDGTVTQLVDEASRAWHAGKSFWRGVTDVNSASIGIEIVNPGHEFGYRPFAPAQIAALKPLLHAIIARHKMNAATCLLAHSDIAPSRKEDPGELFPWQSLAQDGLGLWPMPQPQDRGPLTEARTESLLEIVGYNAAPLPDALKAFQRRYHPENLTGTADPETIARLRALIRRLAG